MDPVDPMDAIHDFIMLLPPYEVHVGWLVLVGLFAGWFVWEARRG